MINSLRTAYCSSFNNYQPKFSVKIRSDARISPPRLIKLLLCISQKPENWDFIWCIDLHTHQNIPLGFSDTIQIGTFKNLQMYWSIDLDEFRDNLTSISGSRLYRDVQVYNLDAVPEAIFALNYAFQVYGTKEIAHLDAVGLSRLMLTHYFKLFRYTDIAWFLPKYRSGSQNDIYDSASISLHYDMFMNNCQM
jgi:hypothetical protein